MLSSKASFDWRADLDWGGVDFEVFVKRELEKGPLLKAGWTPETLLALFQHPHHWMGICQMRNVCKDCALSLRGLCVQPCWLDLLKRHRVERNPKILLETISPLSDKAIRRTLSEEEEISKADTKPYIADDLDIITDEKDSFYASPDSRKIWEDLEYHTPGAIQSRYELLWGEFMC